jgi:F-type H+-transporting ATPase subunit delta
MQGGSSRSLHEVLERTGAELEDGADATGLGDDLFALALSLDGAHSLRRALTEPAVPPEAKVRLLHSLFEGQIGSAAMSVAETAVGMRWSSTRDLPDTLEQASVSAHVTKADSEGHLDDLEDNLFRFSRVVEAHPELREVLSEQSASLEGKQKLVQALVDDKVSGPTERLLSQAVAGRRRNLTTTLAMYQKVAAERRDRLVATVWVAAPLDEQRKERLAAALSAQYSHDVHLNVIVEPEVLGGVRVAIGDDVIDSTIENRLVQAHRRLVR